jgi:tRNA(fMet)-specific endonuclease VapC
VNYFLDTNAVIALLKNQPASVRGRLRRVVSRGASIAVSSLVLYELWYGVARSERRRDNAERLRIFLSGNIDVIPFDEQDAVTAGDLRAALETAGTPIGPYDLLIAAQALRAPYAVARSFFERERAPAIKDLVHPVAAADEGNEVARLKSVLVHMVFDRLHRVREVHRVVPALPCLDQGHQHIEAIALWRAALRGHQAFDLL